MTSEPVTVQNQSGNSGCYQTFFEDGNCSTIVESDGASSVSNQTVNAKSNTTVTADKGDDISIRFILESGGGFKISGKTNGTSETKSDPSTGAFDVKGFTQATVTLYANYEPVSSKTYTMDPSTTYTFDGNGNCSQLTPSSGSVSVSKLVLVNNQCIQFTLNKAVSGAGTKTNYTLTNAAGTQMTIAAVTAMSGANQYQMTFPDPLPAGTYTLSFRSGSVSFRQSIPITLALKVVKVLDARHVIIQLNEPIYGCTTGNNYFFHTLSGEQVGVTSAVSAFAELGGTMPNVFKLTTNKDLKLGTTYVVETRAMSLDAAGNQPCQGTIAYFTPDKFENAVTLTNNQSIILPVASVTSAHKTASNYIVKNSSNQQMTVGNVRQVSQGMEVNFADPLPAGRYTLTTRNISPAISVTFDISLYLSVVKVVDSRNVIIRLNEPIYGCTTANNYFFHSLSGEQVSITSAVSAFQELGGTMTNVFKLTTNKALQAGTTYVVETRAMSLDAAGKQPCQGTIGYFTVPAASSELTFRAGNNSVAVAKGKTTLGRFTATKAGTYTFYTTGSEDTYGYLFNANKEQLVGNDDISSSNRNFKITRTLSAGQTVYVGVRYYSSSHTAGTVTLVIETP